MRYDKDGFDNWHDYEILEYLLTFALPRRDTKPQAKELIRKFGSFHAVLEADPRQIAALRGLGPYTARFINVMYQTARMYARTKTHGTPVSLSTPQQVRHYLTVSMKGLSDESVRALYLNRQNEIVADELLETGTVDTTQVYTRKIVERALRHKASRIILAHNHPSGSLEPSAEDVEVTERIRDALALIEIELLDHVIVGQSGYFSFSDAGLV